MKGFSTAGCALAVLLVGMLVQEAECDTEFILGEQFKVFAFGWTNTANIDYSKWLSTYTIKIGVILSMRIAVQVLNADGSVNATADAADAPKANSASAMPGFSWTSQLLVATVAMVVAAIPVLS